MKNHLAKAHPWLSTPKVSLPGVLKQPNSTYILSDPALHDKSIGSSPQPNSLPNYYKPAHRPKMSDIKLTYFPAKGRAEISRLILSYSGVKFTDERLSGEQFGAIKSSLPWGQIPVLNYKGQVMCQSLSIARWGDKGVVMAVNISFIIQVSCF